MCYFALFCAFIKEGFFFSEILPHYEANETLVGYEWHVEN